MSLSKLFDSISYELSLVKIVTQGNTLKCIYSWKQKGTLENKYHKQWYWKYFRSFAGLNRCPNYIWPISRQCSISMPSENVTEPLIFWRFRGYRNKTLDWIGLMHLWMIFSFLNNSTSVINSVDKGISAMHITSKWDSFNSCVIYYC